MADTRKSGPLAWSKWKVDELTHARFASPRRIYPTWSAELSVMAHCVASPGLGQLFSTYSLVRATDFARRIADQEQVTTHEMRITSDPIFKLNPFLLFIVHKFVLS